MRDEYPRRGELVVCKIEKISPYSAFASLEEYPGKEGMIHVSEISSSWVKDIRKHVKDNERVVCKVLRIDPERGHITLSLKRLSAQEKKSRMNQFKREKRAEKLLEMIVKERGLNVKKAYEKLGHSLIDEYGSLHKAFDSVYDGKTEKVPEDWKELVIEFVKKNFVKEKKEIKGKLKMTFYGPDGASDIKKALKEAEGELKVSYISAPIYQLSLMTEKPKQGEKKMCEIVERIEKTAKSLGGTAGFEREK